jgi:hypothetical protein
MDTHPVTILIGIICTFILIGLVSLGLTCAAYKSDSTTYELFKPYYEYAKSKKVC